MPRSHGIRNCSGRRQELIAACPSNPMKRRCRDGYVQEDYLSPGLIRLPPSIDPGCRLSRRKLKFRRRISLRSLKPERPAASPVSGGGRGVSQKTACSKVVKTVCEEGLARRMAGRRQSTCEMTGRAPAGVRWIAALSRPRRMVPLYRPSDMALASETTKLPQSSQRQQIAASGVS